jgi:hypothetical protein
MGLLVPRRKLPQRCACAPFVRHGKHGSVAWRVLAGSQTSPMSCGVMGWIRVETSIKSHLNLWVIIFQPSHL